MRRALLALIGIITATCQAEELSIEDSTLSKLPKAIESLLYNAPSYSSFKNCPVVGKTTEISAKKETRVFFITTAEGCNWGAAIGPIWLVSVEQSAKKLILVSGGYSVKTEAATHHGLHKISISSGAAGLPAKKEFQFNGKNYIALPK